MEERCGLAADGQVVGGTLYDVKKTSLYIDPDVDRALARRAAGESVTKAELIRRVLADAVAAEPRPRPTRFGVFEGPGDLSARVDEYLAETGFGED